ncbi:integrase, catalytic region, zinc finger, CCHC-type containing protein [Tanacetum coccineum]
MSIQLADQSIKYPTRVCENLLVKVGKFIFPVDFVVLEIDEDELVPIILGRPFLATTRAMIDVHEGKLSLRVGNETITFNIGKSMKSKHSRDNYLYCADQTAKLVEEQWVDTVYHDGKWTEEEEEEDSNNALAVSFHPKTEPVEPLEWKTLRSRLKPSSLEPPELKLKELTEHLEYGFLQENNQLPVVISSALSVDKKTRLLEVRIEKTKRSKNDQKPTRNGKKTKSQEQDKEISQKSQPDQPDTETLAEGNEGALHLGPERPRVYFDLSAKDKERYNADIRATNILLQGLLKYIYSLINHYTNAKDIWDNVKMLLKGSELTNEDLESQLFDDFEHLCQHKRETIHDYYVRFAKLINDMCNIKMTMSRMQLNSKFVNNMLPEWGRLNRGQGNNARGAGVAGYGGAQNRVWNANPGQAKQVKCYNYNGIGHIARNYTQPERPQNFKYFKDKMLLMQAQENGVALDEEQLLFIAADDCYAFDSDVDEAPTAQTMLMANLSSDAVCEHHEEHEMHDDVQPNYVVDSHVNYTSDSNMIKYDLLPSKSQVKINIFALIQLFSEFEKTCKKRITPTGLTEGERGFEQTKECYLTEVIPFFKTLKEHFEGIQNALTKEIKEMKDIFEELEAEVDQNVVNRKHDEIERKNLLIANDNLITDCMSKEGFYIAMNSELTVYRFTKMHEAHTIVHTRCLELEAELSKLRDKVQKDDHTKLVKRFSNLEVNQLNLELKYQNLKESFGNDPSPPARDTPDFD